MPKSSGAAPQGRNKHGAAMPQVGVAQQVTDAVAVDVAPPTDGEASPVKEVRGSGWGPLRNKAAAIAIAVAASVSVSALVAALVASSIVSSASEQQAAPTLTFAGDRRLGQGVFKDLGGEGEDLCLDTEEGEVCHRVATWIREEGLRLHPEAFPKLSRASPLRELQGAARALWPQLCPRPCPAPAAGDGLSETIESLGGPGNCEYGHRGDDRPAHAGCFVVRDGKLLAEKLTYDGRKFDIPGGQTDWHEPARCTAYRETLEETGYLVAPRELIAVVRNNFHLYRCELLQRNPVRGPDHEIAWVGWMDPGEVLAHLSSDEWRFPEASSYVSWLP